jgi:two-component system sensor histidine kinase VicK
MVVYLLLILFAMELIGAYFIQSLNHYFVDNYTKTIAHEAVFLANVINVPLSGSAKTTNLQSILQPFAGLAGAKVYVLDRNGTVVATSGNPFLVGQKRVDPEVNGALLGLQSEEIAIDPATKQRELYLAVPIRAQGIVKGVVEIVAPMNGVYQSIARIIIILATSTLLALGLSAILTVIISRTITGPIKAVTHTARALAGGDFDQEVDIFSNDEIGELAATFNMLTRRLKQATRNTEREKRRLQAVLSTMGDGVVATNANQSVVLINPAALRLLQIQGMPVGSSISELLPGDFPAGQARVVEQSGKVLAVYVTALARLDESPSSGVNLAHFFNEEVDPQGGMVYVLRDVTEETRLEEARKRFVADVSHELRTPITVLRSYVEALLDGAYEEQELALQFLQVMDRETVRMARLIQDLLQLSRLDSGYETINKEKTSTNELVNRLAERFALLAFQSNIQFITDVAETSWIWVDKDRFNQVLDNIVSNSLKYTPNHGMIKVSASYDHEHQTAVFLIKDSGTGIPEDDMQHIFDRFYRVDKARSRQLGGTGLGLSIAREIIRAHDGEIEITSKAGGGTVVRITLPAKEGEKP